VSLGKVNLIMMKKIIILLFLIYQACLYGQCGPACQLGGVGMYMWLGDGDSQAIGDATNDNEDNDDFIAFKNYSSVVVDISGWQLYADRKGIASPVFTFPAGTVLQPGQYAMVVADWNPGPALPNLWFDANFATGEGMFEEGGNNDAWAILLDPVSNQYITIHQAGNSSQGQSLAGSTKACNTNVTNSVPNDFDGCQTIFFNQNTCTFQTATDCSLPLINSSCGQISNLSPSLSSYSVNYSCPASGYNLNSLHTATPPSGSSLVWFTNATNTGTAYSQPSVAQPGTYYAFYFISASGCYSASSSPVTVSEAIVNAPTLSASTLRNICPASTANLNSLHTGTIPTGMNLVWFTNNTHSGASVSDPTTVTTGVYYAYYYSSSGNCYSNVSNSVTVSIFNDCYCTQPPTGGVPDGFGKIGVTMQTKLENWPQNIPNAFLTLESKNKGFVITRVPSQTSIADPKEGMIIYDISANCIKLFNGTAWNCIKRSCNN
jgi:hypothetical protein